MDKITRYLILLLIIVVFFVLAPLIVLYVSGTGFNFGENLSAGTGILDIQSDPNDAEVFINGEKIDSTPTTERFIKQGSYTIKVSKSGYRSWEKQLFVEAGQVTYAGTLGDLIKLLPDEQPIRIDDNGIISVSQRDNQLIYIRDNNSVVVYDYNQNKILNEKQLSEPVVSLSDTDNSNYLLAKTKAGATAILTISTLELTKLPAQLSASTNIQISNDGIVFAITNSRLMAYNLNSKITTTALDENVLGFTTSNNVIYIAKVGNPSLATYYWDGENLIAQTTILTEILPEANHYELLLTNHKELFLLTDSSLYRVNQQLDLINNQVQIAKLNRYRSQLTFLTPTEIFYYNFISNKAEQFHRVTSNINTAIVSPELGYGFLATETAVEAIEIDNRNGQNRYQLFNMGPVTTAMLTYDEKSLVILANNQLYRITVDK